MKTVAEYLASYGVIVTPEREAELIKIASAYQAAGLCGFWEALPHLILPSANGMFDRLTDEVILVGGKHYRIMSDAETADFIWGTDINIQTTPTAAEGE